MSYLPKIAWRNLRRHKLRSFISIIAVAVVVIIVIFVRGLMIGFNESMFSFYINNQTGHVRVVNQEYRLREALMPLDYTIDGFEGRGAADMIARISEIDEVEHVLPRIRFGAMAGIEGVMVRMAGVGIDPEAEAGFGYLPGDVVEGGFPRAGYEVLAGTGLLEELRADVGDGVTMVVPDVFRSLQGRTFSVAGSRESGVAMLDDNFFYLPLDTAQDVLFLHDEVTEILVYGRHRGRAENIAGKIESLIDEEGETGRYAVEVWSTADPMIETLRGATGFMDYVYVFFILLGTIVLITTMTMIVRERTTEIGMMSALGLKKSDIMKVFTLEGAFKGVIGSLLGIIGGGFITHRYSVRGIHVEPLIEAVQEMDVLFEPVLYTSFSLENLLAGFFMSVIIVTLACLIPARKAARMNPVDALHE